MTIEATLERIAEALEAIAAKGGESAPVAQAVQQAAAPQTTAHVAAEAPRPRGRPRKNAKPDVAEAPPPADEEAEEGGGLDFLDDAGDTPEAAVTKTYTIEEVRKALADLQTRVGTPRALALFKEVSGGAERLPQLSEDKYAEVFEAAEKMRK